jgi:hypothetical protein
MAFLEKPRAQLNRLPRLRRFELFAAFVGLIADLIALSSYVGIVVKSPAPPGTPRGHEEFFVWMFIALVYSLGFINSHIYRRWRRSAPRRSRFDDDTTRRIALAALTSLPVTFVYLRALGAAGGTTQQSPLGYWTGSPSETLFLTVVVSFFVVPVIAFAAYAFDMVISALASPR